MTFLQVFSSEAGEVAPWIKSAEVLLQGPSSKAKPSASAAGLLRAGSILQLSEFWKAEGWAIGGHTCSESSARRGTEGPRS